MTAYQRGRAASSIGHPTGTWSRTAAATSAAQDHALRRALAPAPLYLGTLPVVLSLPELGRDGPLVRAALLAWCVVPALLLWGVYAKPRHRISWAATIPVGVLIATVAIACIRQGQNGEVWGPWYAAAIGLTWAGVVASTVSILALTRDLAAARWAVVLSSTILVATSVALSLIMGTKVGRYDTAQMLEIFGLETARVTFPLSTVANYNAFGTVAAASLVAVGICAAHVLSRSSKERPRTSTAWMATLLLAVSLYGVLRTDSRGALVYAAATLAIVALQRVTARKITLVLVALVPLTAPATLAVTSWLGTVSTSAAASEGGRASVASASGRAEIWEPVLRQITEDRANALVGFGAYGQLTSGVSAQYAAELSDASLGLDARTATAHNLALQAVLDGGLLLLGALVAVFYVSLRRFAREASRVHSIAGGLMVYWILVGATEASPSIYFAPTFASFLLVACLAPFAGGTGGRRRRGSLA